MNLRDYYNRFRHNEDFRQVIRYLFVGGWNTLFGIAVYTFLYWWLGAIVHYLILVVIANILSVTNAYICYKLFVFKTKGRIIREYLRCYVVYGTALLGSFAAMFLLVSFLHMNPVLANILITLATVVISYVGHRFFSFRPPAAERDDAR